MPGGGHDLRAGTAMEAVESLGTLPPAHLKPNTALSFLDKAIQIERQARGEPTEIVEQRTKDVQEPTNVWDALRRDDVRELLAKLGRRSAPPPPPATIPEIPHAEPSCNGNGVAHKNGKPPGANGTLPHP